jgi:hypothetical protein
MFLPLRGYFLGYCIVVDEQAIGWEQAFTLKSEFRLKVRMQAGVYQILRDYPALLGSRQSHVVSLRIVPNGAPCATADSAGTVRGKFWIEFALELLGRWGRKVRSTCWQIS